MSLTLCVLVGLPAAGKTTFAELCQEFVRQNHSDLHVCLASYDKLMPEKVYFEQKKPGISHDSEKYDQFGDCNQLEREQGMVNSTWKTYRDKVFNVIRKKTRQVSGANQSNDSTYGDYFANCNASDCDDSFLDSKLDLCDCFLKQELLPSSQHHVFLIDDNMFYSSMRYIYFQLARELQCSYCQIFITQSIPVLIGRNKKRNLDFVSSDTILKMADLIEEPKPTKNTWEQNTMVIDNEVTFSEKLLADVVNFFRKISSEVVKPIVSQEEIKSRDNDRQKCLESFCHQCDLLIRKHISSIMRARQNDTFSKKDLQRLGRGLNDCRKKFLGQLKSEDGCGLPFDDVELTWEIKEQIIHLFMGHVTDVLKT